MTLLKFDEGEGIMYIALSDQETTRYCVTTESNMTLGYEAFARLLKLKMTLSRSAHTADVRHKTKLKLAMDHIDRVLA